MILYTDYNIKYKTFARQKRESLSTFPPQTEPSFSATEPRHSQFPGNLKNRRSASVRVPWPNLSLVSLDSISYSYS